MRLPPPLRNAQDIFAYHRARKGAATSVCVKPAVPAEPIGLLIKEAT